MTAEDSGKSVMDWGRSEIHKNMSMVFGSYTVACDYFTIYGGGSMTMGADGDFTTTDGKTVTVTGGLITNIS